MRDMNPEGDPSTRKGGRVSAEMIAELWLVKPCEHGATEEHAIDDMAWTLEWCSGGSRVRLDPDKVVFPGFTIGSEYVGSTAPSLTVQDVIDALRRSDADG